MHTGKAEAGVGAGSWHEKLLHVDEFVIEDTAQPDAYVASSEFSLPLFRLLGPEAELFTA